jgi:nondiscriminating glutamyl-tRNA synthetase
MLTTRFAPSPTGYLHIGWVRTALYNRLLAKQQWGKYLLRIEDTDQTRSDDTLVQPILDGFRRLGLDRDAGPEKDDENGPYFQMQRLPIHQTYLQKLIDQGYAYEARESTEELETMRTQAEQAKTAFIYRKQPYTDEEITQYKSEWRKPVIRLVVPQQDIIFHDHIKGEVHFHGKDIWDFVLMKADGSPIYYFANMLDDALQWVNLVIRAEEHLSNTPKQIILYTYFGFTLPEFAHLPLMLNPNGKKLSKRHATPEFLIALHQFQEAGFLPQALLNFVALVGRNPWGEQEIFTIDELIQLFSLERVVKSNAVYDYQRALWFNSQYLSSISDEAFITATVNYLKQYWWQARAPYIHTLDHGYWMSFARHIKVRIQTLSQFRDHCLYFFQQPNIHFDIIHSEKMQCSPDIVQGIIPQIIDLLSTINDRTESTLKASLITFANTHGYKNWQVLRPIRAILTGVQASPGAFEMLEVLGKQESLARLALY